MGFVCCRKAHVLQKARRKRRRPEWQAGRTPRSTEGKDAYAIAAKHEARFAKAFLRMQKELIDPTPSTEFRKAYKAGSMKRAMASIPFFSNEPDDQTWEKFVQELVKSYSVILQEAGEDSTRQMNKDFGTNMKFTISPVKKDVEKANGDDGPRVEPGARIEDYSVRVVPVNPHAIKWMRKRSLDLIKKDMTPEQKKVVRDILDESFEQGLRMEESYEIIKSNIGLTTREQNAVLKRRVLHEEAGLPAERVDHLTDAYREKLLMGRAQRIARTETQFAQAEGRRESWQLAQEEGILPPVEREWMAVGGACPICEGIDGSTAPVDGAYESEEGPIEAPPAHPNCVCTERLTRKKAS